MRNAVTESGARPRPDLLWRPATLFAASATIRGGGSVSETGDISVSERETVDAGAPLGSLLT